MRRLRCDGCPSRITMIVRCCSVLVHFDQKYRCHRVHTHMVCGHRVHPGARLCATPRQRDGPRPLLSDDQDCRASCLSGECHPARGCCLTEDYTVASSPVDMDMDMEPGGDGRSRSGGGYVGNRAAVIQALREQSVISTAHSACGAVDTALAFASRIVMVQTEDAAASGWSTSTRNGRGRD
jgi:hypothetical protein